MTVTPLPDALEFSDRSVCVTGAAGGIGRATAELFHRLGAHVHAADRDAAGMAALAAERPGMSSTVYDQAKIDSCEMLFETVGPVDVLVANAGILLYEPLIDLNWDDMNRIVQVNFLGTMAVTRLFGEAMIARGKGAMVLTSSQLAFNGSDCRSVYAATKAAINQFVKTAALEWGPHGVRVNAVAPGRTLTPMNRHLSSPSRPTTPRRWSGCRSGVSAIPPTSPTPWCSLPPMPPPTSRATRWWSMAAGFCPDQ